LAKHKITLSKQAVKYFQKLPAGYKSLLRKAIDNLENGIPADAKPIKGTSYIYRIRIGKYRVLIENIANEILIAKIGPRGDIYK
jgi:mRNA-degrading endonuclease RelE of RelBE toxin-antitoxin system